VAGEALPERFGRYRPVRILGAGASGTVYLAEDPVLDRQVTVKVIRTAGMDEATRVDFLTRFRIEARAAGRCTHPGIVAIHDFAESHGTPFIVMEYIDGPNLHRALQEPALRAGLDPIAILLQILDALGTAHRLSIIHRDVKPANILMTRAGRVKIADFGVARLDGRALTQCAAMVGTPSYMAPEQAQGGKIDHRADLFAAGALLYEMLTGKPPFLGETLPATLISLMGPEPVSTATLPPALAPVLARALAKAPETRFQSAADFAAALQGTPTSLPEPTITAPPLTSHKPESLTNATAAGYWGVSYLKALETALARHVGPIATVLIRNAATRTSEAQSLHTALAESLDKAAARSEFLREVAPLRPQSEGTLKLPSAPPPPIVVATPLALSPAVLQTAEAALAQHIGPIAKLLVRKAAERSASIEDFRDRLAANLTKPEEASAFRRRLNQALERPNRS